MTSRRELQGAWRGCYHYDQALAGQVDTDFELTWTIGWFGSLRGAVVDTVTNDFGKASISGRLRRAQVRFIKTYAAFWACDDEGRVADLAAAYASVGVDLVGQVPPHRVLYEGVCTPNSLRFVGRWETSSLVLADRQRGAFVAPGMTGTWHMEKVR
ncbi:MAG: hypothetical protein ABIP94_15470 [Planctomycetota bacterium]